MDAEFFFTSEDKKMMSSGTELVLPVLYETDSLFVINKPAGLTVNRSDTTIHESTVQDWTEEKLGIGRTERLEEPIADYTSDAYFEQTFLERGGIVHRLDKETSGALIVAKTWQSFKELQRQFRERIVRKKYLALVHGKLTPASGEIDVPVDRLPWNRRQFGIVAGGRPSVTFYRVLESYSIKTGPKEPLSLVELEPKTGRTHQIRVHMKYLNHPIFSDFLYGGRKVSRGDRELLPRVFLHAAKIIFFDPENGEEVMVESPMTAELTGFLAEFLIKDA